MKLILLIFFVLVIGWCCFGCGGGYSVDPNKTHQIDTLPDSLRVKEIYKGFKYDTTAPIDYRIEREDSIRKRKLGQ